MLGCVSRVFADHVSAPAPWLVPLFEVDHEVVCEPWCPICVGDAPMAGTACLVGHVLFCWQCSKRLYCPRQQTTSQLLLRLLRQHLKELGLRQGMALLNLLLLSEGVLVPALGVWLAGPVVLLRHWQPHCHIPVWWGL